VGVEDRVSLAEGIESLLRHAPAGDQRLFALLLHGIELGAPFAAGRFGRFSSMEAPDRERALRRWAGSAMPSLRQGVASLRALAALVHYGAEEGWTHAAYDGPWLGRVDIDVHAPPESPPVVRGRDEQRDIAWTAQACVIGSGAGGAAAAARLAAAGVDVVLLEAGGETRASDFDQHERNMLPLLYRDAGLRATHDKAIGILQGTGLGGSTLHNTGLVVETPAGILQRWRSEHGFQWDDVVWNDYADTVTRTLHAVPVPEERVTGTNVMLRRGAGTLGWRWRIARHNRSACSGCGYCMLGCAYGRKWNASLTWIPSALRDGARVLCDAEAVLIERTSSGHRVHCRLRSATGRPNGRTASIDAQIVLVAAGGLETPALLQHSRIGNARVGRGLRLHPTPLVYAVFDDDVTPWRGVPQSVLVEEFADFEKDGRGGFLLLASAATQPGLAAAAAPGIGAQHRILMRDLVRTAIGGVLLHDEGEGSVRAARDGRPVARYRIDVRDREALNRGVRALSQVFLEAGARRVHLPFADAPAAFDDRDVERILARASWAPHRVLLNAVHPQATCAIGNSARTAAANPSGEVFGAPGVFVCDASAFPTSVGVPPQVTIMALACGIADSIARERLH
jgi:choline dehydrogenase-like flavoprotein